MSPLLCLFSGILGGRGRHPITHDVARNIRQTLVGGRARRGGGAHFLAAAVRGQQLLHQHRGSDRRGHDHVADLLCPLAGRGLHLSTFRLKVSAFCVTGGAFRSCLRGV